MDVVKQWTLNICLTLIGAVILSLVSPRGSMGRFYKIESRVKQTLTAAGYKDCSVQASVRIKEQEIYIQKLVVSVPGDMDREAVAALLKAQLGLQPVVKGLGE